MKPSVMAAAEVVSVISTLLERVTERNDAARTEVWSAFRSTRKPDISVRDYMARIAQYARCSPDCFVAAYIYLDRHGFLAALDSYNVHRLLITSLLVAVKFVDAGACEYDGNINAYFARVGGIDLPDMNHMELDFLLRVKFRLFVSTETFRRYRDMIRSEMLCLQIQRLPLPSSSQEEEDDDDAGSSQEEQREA